MTSDNVLAPIPQAATAGAAPADSTPMERSEFGRPAEMRTLAARLLRDLVDPCDSAVKAAQSRHAEERREADTTLRDGQAEADQLEAQANARAANQQAQVDEALARSIGTAVDALTTVRGQAERALNHMALFSGIKGIPVPKWLTADDGGPPSTQGKVAPTTTSEFLEVVDKWLSEVKDTCSFMTGIEPQVKFFRPNDDALVIGFAIVALVVAAMAMTLVPGVTSFAAIAAGAYVGCLTMWRGSRRSTLRDLFGTIALLGGHVASEAYTFIRMAKTAKAKATATVSRDLTAALESCAAHRRAVEDRYSWQVNAADASLAAALLVLKNRFMPIAIQLHADYAAFNSKAGYAAHAWNDPVWHSWAPDASPEFAAQIGCLRFDIESVPTIAELRRMFADFRAVPPVYALPALLPFAEGKGLLMTATGDASQVAAEAVQSVLIRALANTPPGRARFTLIDPVGLGHNVADLMHLGDFDPMLISGKAWTEPRHIEEQLAKVTEEMETVIQTFLRRKYAAIEEYNRDNPAVAEPFRFVVIFDFPVNLSDDALRRLLSILGNGPRCGVFTMIMRDTSKPNPDRFSMSALEGACTAVSLKAAKETSGGDDTRNELVDSFRWQEDQLSRFSLSLDRLPPHPVTTGVVRVSGESAEQGMRKEVPFARLIESVLANDSWQTASAAEELRTALGPGGKGSPQYLRLGGSQEAHALLVGRTGSGKTNLMHVIITGLALKYSPSELQLYLIDFKAGVGFKRYADHLLPHASVIAIETEREFGISVLKRLDDELKRRAELFRASGVDNLASYRSVSGTDGEPMPRILLVVDEFQEFFTENDNLAQEAKIILERLARQGRSFGIHFLLATQSLTGSAQLPSSILGQIKVRIALPCTESDSRLVLADDNKAARLLSRPGEAIYNPMAGTLEGNNRFQVALFSEEHDLEAFLGRVSARAQAAGISPQPVVFEGNELARVENCAPLKDRLSTPAWQSRVNSIDLHLGEPIAIQPPVSARLRRQSGANLLILARDEREGVGMCLAALLNILSQSRPDQAQIFIADLATADSEWAGFATMVASWFPATMRVITRQREIGSVLSALAETVRARADSGSPSGSAFLLLQGMHRIRALREDTEDDDGLNAVELLGGILRDGPEVGVHVVAWADTLANASRGSRRIVSQFGLRVGSVMSSEDSVSFLDTPAAAKLTKPHRAVFADEDRPGVPTTFRPYAMPTSQWLAQTGLLLRAGLTSLQMQ